MSLSNFFRITHTLAFRLAVLYAGIFTLSFLGVVLFLNIQTNFARKERTAQESLRDAKEIPFVLVLKDPEKSDTGIVLASGEDGVGEVFYRIESGDAADEGSSSLPSLKLVPDEAALQKFNSGSAYSPRTLVSANTPNSASILYSNTNNEGKDSDVRLIGKGNTRKEILWRIDRTLNFTLTFVAIFSGAVGWFMAKRALRGVEEVTRTAIQISSGEYNSRVKISGGGEEIDRLAMTFNNMLERIQALIHGMREMTDNIAHDLRSPITRIRGIAETTVTTTRGQRDFELMAGNIVEECDRLLNIINMMLDISEAEANITKLMKSEVDCSVLLKKACEIFQPVADDKGIRIVMNPGDDVTIYADIKKLQRVVANLLDNAVKYSRTEVIVSVSAFEDGTGVSISFKDDGSGISPKDLPKVFKRFYRCDSSRSKTGNGLGLSWAQAIIHAHGGRISVISTPGKGSTFTITLPEK